MSNRSEGRAEVEVPVDRRRVQAVVADLGTWPSWAEIVQRAVPDGRGAWNVRLGVGVGPVALGYGVRMERVRDEPGHVRFERVEDDGRADHSVVVIDVALASSGDGTRVRLELEVGKRLPLVSLQRELDRRRLRVAERLARTCNS